MVSSVYACGMPIFEANRNHFDILSINQSSIYFNLMSNLNANLLKEKSFPSQPQSALLSSGPIEGRYYLKELVKVYPQYTIYEGVDCSAMKLVSIYLKPSNHLGQSNSDFAVSKRIKEELRLKISPSVKWSGVYKLEKTTCNAEVHQKFGPSLKTMFAYMRQPLSPRDFLLLMYHLVRLVQKFATIGYVFRELDMEHVVFDPRPEKCDLFLLNVFPLRKKGEECAALNSRFCSRGAHLGLRASRKDDLESVCYILLNIFSRGSFLKKVSGQALEQAKAQIDLNGFKADLPQIFKQFYAYTINLNHDDEVNYFQWRTELYNLIGKDALAQPYGWMIAKHSKNTLSSLTQTCEDKSLGQQPQLYQQRPTEQLEDEVGLTEELEDELGPADRQILRQVNRKCLQRNKR